MNELRFTKRFFAGLLFFSFLLFQYSYATTYYLDPAGNNNSGNGSASKPWKTLYYASWEVKSGDIIHLNPGKYSESTMVQIIPGVSIEGAGIDVTTVVFSSGYGFILESDPVVNGNQSIKNLTIDGNSKKLGTGLFVEGRHNVTVDHVKFINIQNTGLDISSYGAKKETPPNIYLKDIKVLNNIFVNCASDQSTHSTGALQIGNLVGGEIGYNTITENIGYGIKFTSWGWFKSTKIHHNNITVPRNDNLWDSDMAIELWNVYDNCEVYENVTNNWFSFVHGGKGSSQRSLSVYNNRIIMPVVSGGNLRPAMEVAVTDVEIYGNYMENFKHGVAIWKDEPIQNMKIHHNIMYGVNSESRGVYIFPQAGIEFKNIEIYNNTIDVESSGINVYASTNPIVRDLKIKNNLIMNATHGVVTSTNKSSGLRITGMEIVNNNFYQVKNTMTNWDANITNLIFTLVKNLFANPQTQSSGNRYNGYYALKSGSPLIDEGVNVGFSYNGSAPDIGALEYGGATQGNQAPSANAGGDQTVSDGDGDGKAQVTLNGSGSSDPDGNITSYIWSENGSQLASGTKPSVNLTVGTHNITLTVTDDDGSKDTDQVTVNVNGSSSTQGGDQVVSFTLIDAVSEQAISKYDPIPNGAVIDLETLPHQELNIRANTSPSTVGSVELVLTGPKNQSVTESYKPYTLFGDGGGKFNNWSPPLGNYTLSGTAYSEGSGNGQSGPTKTISFSVTKGSGGSSPPPEPDNNGVITLTLYDAITDQPISQFNPIPNGAVIDISKLSHSAVNIKANTSSNTNKVTFNLRGAEVVDAQESVAPYALFGDNNGNFKAWYPKSGSYTLKVTPFTNSGAGAAYTISFSIANSNARTASTSFSTKSKFNPAEESLAAKPDFSVEDNLEWLYGDISDDCQLFIYNRLGQILHQIPSVTEAKEIFANLLPGKEYYYMVKCSRSVKQSGGLIKLP